MQKCPNCNSPLSERKKASRLYKYRNKTKEIKQPGYWCKNCKEGVLKIEDIKTTEKALHDFRAKVDGFLTSSEVKRIRKKLNLTQHQAALIFGGGPNAFSRYERGEALQLKATDNLLRLLDKHPAMLLELKSSKVA